MNGPRYLHGHHASVMRSHTWRTIANSAAYLEPHLRPGLDLLDVGCGPGTITAELAARLRPGRVVGVDQSAEVVERARAAFPDVDFRVDDIADLHVEAGSFDIVHAHQVMQHLPDPVAALGDLFRVLRPGGIVAVRDAVYASFAWAPDDALLVRWNELYHQIARRDGGEPDAGRYLPAWASAAGFVDPVVSSSTWTFADDAGRAWWGGSWAERVRRSAFADHGVEYGLTDRDELEAIATAWERWAVSPSATFVVVHVEVLARRPV